MGEPGQEVKTSCCRRVRVIAYAPILCADFAFPEAIDYIQELNATKDDLLSRLAQAKGALPPGHPLLSLQSIPNSAMDQTIPLWEREWNYSPDADDEESEDEAN
jgi:hypothetical protein